MRKARKPDLPLEECLYVEPGAFGELSKLYTTTQAVEKVFSMFFTTPVNVKRKYKSYSQTTRRSQCWWFVVRAEESVPVQVEKDWVPIEVQTG